MTGAIRDVPPSLDGSGPDPFLLRLRRAVAGMERMTRNCRRGVARPHPVDRVVPLVVTEVRPEAADVVSLRLEDPDGRALPAWHPGAHLDVRLPSGRTRQYSLCGPVAERGHYRIAVRRIPGGAGSAEVHQLRTGVRISAKGPRNAFPHAGERRVLFVAGGIGITPILPMVRSAAARGDDWRLVHTGRDRASMPFVDEVSELDPDRVWIRPDTEFGIPTSGAELLDRAPRGAAVYACGPTPVITGIRLALPDSPARALHWERFSAPPIADGRAFTVELARSGRTVEVPADRTALQAIAEVLPEVAYSCRQGFCGTCHARLLDGEVRRRGRAGGEEVAICVDRAEGTLVLDL
ncbi:PDR/VanB family oxidoreductase [Saccharopolyspora griseoalba]|uniref:PDR/VanB family oxidoreductase n=1 Tax=Saccharopolyspora griseoalba TaxID=1431848 RepID=A0ABW2LEZ0_9PSEU